MAKVYVADTSKSVSYTFATSIFFFTRVQSGKKRKYFSCPLHMFDVLLR